MRTFVRVILLCVSLPLLARAACAQPQQLAAQQPRCAALRTLYWGVVSDKAHRTVEEQSSVEYEEAKKYLRVCWEAGDDFTRSLRKFVARHEDFARCEDAWVRLGPRILLEGSGTSERQAQIYETSKEFLRICDGAETEKALLVKSWVEKYDAAVRQYEAEKTLASLAGEARAGSTQPSVYSRMAEAYVAARYEPRMRHLLALIETGKSPDSKEVRATWAEVTASLDSVIDSYARAIALCGAGEGCQVATGSWMASLIKFYGLRHDGSQEGLRQTIDRVRPKQTTEYERPAGTPQPPRDEPCRAAGERYLWAFSDERHMMIEQKYQAALEEGGRYLRLCGDRDDDFTRYVKASVAVAQAARRCAQKTWPLYSKRVEVADTSTLARHGKSYEAAKEFLNLCGRYSTIGTSQSFRRVNEYEAAARLDEARKTLASLVPAVRAAAPGATAPETYARIAEAYTAAWFEPAHSRVVEIQDRVKPESKELREMKARRDAAIDRIIDAYARAIASCGVRAECRESKATWRRQLALFYSFGNDDYSGLDETIARAFDAPMPNL